MRIGHGYDAHRFAEGRDLILGGVKIDYGRGLDGHSDADVVAHAIMDALLGAAALGDIGVHFPPSDEAYRGISSLELCRRVAGLIASEGYRIGNIDATIVAQQPKLAAHLHTMCENLADALGCDARRISVKATTEEKMGFTGRLEGISTHAVCLLEERWL